MISLVQLLKEAEETFTAVNRKSGKVSVFKSKASRDAAIKSGTHTQPKKPSEPVSKPKMSTASTSTAAAAKARATGEQPKDEPVSQSASNPMVNKSTKDMAEKAGITPRGVGRQEYRKKMMQAAVSALTDANFHSEARELVNKLTGDGMEDPAQYEKADDDARELGIGISKSAGWDGEQAANGIAYTLRMNGLHKEADTILSVFKR